MMKWCCTGFEQWYSLSEERGLGIVVGRADSGDPVFSLQHRAVEPGVRLPDTEGVAVSLVDRTPISHCPWCGRRLDRWYKKAVEELHNADPIEDLVPAASEAK
jgi:hypothetical protein